MSLYVPVNVPVKEYECKNEGKTDGRNDGKKWLFDGKMSVKCR